MVQSSKFINLFLYISLILTVFVIVIHIQEEISIINLDSGKENIEFNFNDLKINCHIRKYDDEYEAILYFYPKFSEIHFINLKLDLKDYELTKIYFQGYSESAKYSTFEKFPDTLLIKGESKRLPASVRYKFININSSPKLKLTIESKIIINGKKSRRINENYELLEESSYVIKSLDPHNDYLFTLLPYLIIINLFLILFKIAIYLYIKLREKNLK